MTVKPLASSKRITLLQLDPSAKAPCTNTTVVPAKGIPRDASSSPIPKEVRGSWTPALTASAALPKSRRVIPVRTSLGSAARDDRGFSTLFSISSSLNSDEPREKTM